MGEEREVYKVLVGKPVGKRPIKRPRRRWDQLIFGRLAGWWSGFMWLRIATGGEFL
jgi:hypothetical protein